ncbi:MAG TPA: DUF1080 domain-containing protein [Cytophagaceae bacterium]|jgi:hypothetical protein
MGLQKFSLLFLSFSWFYQNSFSQVGDPKLTEVYQPIPVKVSTIPIPSDAISLFNGKDLQKWIGKDGKPAAWVVKNGTFTVKQGSGDIETTEKFGDQQLHLEFNVPTNIKGEGQDRGNSGVFIMGEYEVQILDNYENKTYVNGQVGSVYKQSIPLVNACKKAGEWQTYDIIFRAPKFKADSSLESPAFITVLHNGVLIQNHYELKGKTVYIGQPYYTAHGDGPLKLQDHGHLVSFRNIWVRKL